MRAFTLVAAVALIVVPLAGCVTDGTSAPKSAAGRTAATDGAAAVTEWRFTDTNGTEHSNTTTRGDPTVIFFMATWCSSCKQKAPVVADVAAGYAPRGVTFLSVGVDPTETDAQLEAWKERYAQPWSHGVDADGNVQRAFGIRAQSSLVVLDAHGREVAKWQYPGASEEQLRAAVEDALARST